MAGVYHAASHADALRMAFRFRRLPACDAKMPFGRHAREWIRRAMADTSSPCTLPRRIYHHFMKRADSLFLFFDFAFAHVDFSPLI